MIYTNDLFTHMYSKFIFIILSVAAQDTTLMSLLAIFLQSHWDMKWPPYASLLSMEIYVSAESMTRVLDLDDVSSPTFTPRTPPSSHLFRVVYNSHEVTSLIPGCPSDSQLCVLDTLLSIVAYTDQPKQCERRGVVSPSSPTVSTDTNPVTHPSRDMDGARGRGDVATGGGGSADSNLRKYEHSGKSMQVQDWLMLCVLSAALGAMTGAIAVNSSKQKTIQYAAVSQEMTRLADD